jgi:hypothetical protein
MHESIDEGPNFTNICIFRGENAYLWRNFNVICRVHTFFHIFSKLLPQSLKFQGWDRFDGIRRIHYCIFVLISFYYAHYLKLSYDKDVQIILLWFSDNAQADSAVRINSHNFHG